MQSIDIELDMARTCFGELTLEQAVAKAGGYTPRADKGSVILRRQSWPESKLIRLGQTALKVAPGDTITVQESFF